MHLNLYIRTENKIKKKSKPNSMHIFILLFNPISFYFNYFKIVKNIFYFYLDIFNTNKEESKMPDRSNGNSQATLNSASTGTSSASSTTSNTDAPDSQNFLSPYNTNNFMAPPIGAIIRVVTCLGNTVQGKVIAYDQQAKILALSM